MIETRTLEYGIKDGFKTKELMIKDIYKKISKIRNVGNEIEGDYIIEEVLIGDVLDYLDYGNNYNDSEYRKGIYNLYDLKRLPIEEQGTDCIKYIYNLIK